MELNAEINKIFGEEMAKIFSQTMTEGELKEKAESAWRSLNRSPERWSQDKRTDMQKLVEKAIGDKVQNRIEELLETEEYQKRLIEEAEEIIREAKENAHKEMVKFVASNLLQQSLAPEYAIEAKIIEIFNRSSGY